MEEIVKRIKPILHRFINNHQYDAVAFVPPTIKREIQIIKFLSAKLEIPLFELSIRNNSGLIAVPQKSLSKIEARINNANNTFYVESKMQFKHLLMIDDAVGSGATFNQIAKQIKNKKIAKQITCIAVVGSYEGFDVITDV